MRHAFCGRVFQWALIALLGMGAVAPARAETVIDVNTTIDYAINDDVSVTGRAVVNLVAGGSITGGLDVRDNSTVNVDGGSVGDSLAAAETSTVNIRRGSIATAVVALGSSTVNVSGGSVGRDLTAWEQSTVNVSGGSVGQNDDGRGLLAGDSSRINVRGGSTPGALMAVGNSTISFSGGSVGEVGDNIGLVARDTSTVHFSGGSVRDWVSIQDSSTLYFSGGSIGQPHLSVAHNSTLHVFGCNLALSNPIAFWGGGGATYRLTGTLRDGRALNHTAAQADTAAIRLHPVEMTLEARIDIQPGDAQNIIRLDQAQITVVILSTATFDATQVNPISVTFGPGQAREIHGRGHVQEMNGDGRLDMVLHFSTPESGLTAQDRLAWLRGSTFGGCFFQGYDFVRVIPKGG